jgi:hypothetical protein
MNFSFILSPFAFILYEVTSFPQSACSQFLSRQCEHPSFSEEELAQGTTNAKKMSPLRFVRKRSKTFLSLPERSVE